MKIVLILLFSLSLRLLFLNIYPNGLTNDELHFVLNAKTVFLNFSNLANNWSPLSLKTIPGEPSSELTFFAITPIIGPLPLNLFTARLPFVLYGIGSILLLYLISKIIFNKSIATIIALIASINPWFIFVTRTSFDAPIAIFFFLLTLFLLLKLKNNFLLFSIVPSIFAFYCYIGTKVIFVPVILSFCYFSYLFSRKYKFQYLLISCFSIVLFISYFLTLKSSGSFSRTQELWTPFSSSISLQVENERQLAINHPLKSLFLNRYTVYSRLFITKYLNNFSPDVLFLKGDPTYLVSLWHHGYFYLLDILFLFSGLYFLFTKYRRLFYFLIFLVLLSPIPEAIRSDTIPAYAFHSSFQYPFLFIIIGCGLYFIFINSPRIFKYILVLLQTYLFLNFLFTYFLAYPFYQPEGFFLSNRLISQYISFQKQNSDQNIVFLTREPVNMFRNYLFYTNSLDRSHLANIIQSSSGNLNSVKYENLLFTTEYNQVDFKNTVFIIERQLSDRHYMEASAYSINRLSDNVPMFGIYNSSLCPINSVASFPRTYNYSLFNINPMDINPFCQNFVFNINQVSSP